LGGGGLEEKYNYLVEVETKHSGITWPAYFSWCLMNKTLLKANDIAKNYYICSKLILYAPL
jgi:hypothetical protein